MKEEAYRNLEDDVLHIMIDDKTVQARVHELAQQIDNDYADKGDLLLVCVLKGGYMFLADLSRALKRPHELDFLAISSYGAGTKSSGAVQIIMDLKAPIEERHVLIIEDIIDSGRTLQYLRRSLEARRPASVRICTLLSKPARREVDVPVDYTGFEIPDEFVVGYGLDFAEEYRNFPYIAVLKPAVFEHIIDQ